MKKEIKEFEINGLFCLLIIIALFLLIIVSVANLIDLINSLKDVEKMAESTSGTGVDLVKNFSLKIAEEVIKCILYGLSILFVGSFLYYAKVSDNDELN